VFRLTVRGGRYRSPGRHEGGDDVGVEPGLDSEDVDVHDGNGSGQTVVEAV